MSTTAATIAILGALGIITTAVFIKKRRRFINKVLLRRQIGGYLRQRVRSISVVEFLGVGNVGAVYACELGEGWERDLGIQWRSALPIPPVVAVKLCPMKGVPERIEQLSPVAKRVDAAHLADPAFPLCPFLALGSVEPIPGKPMLVQVMPILPGPSLKDALPRCMDQPQQALGEFLRVLSTVQFLESVGVYTRNLDAENVMFDADGRWVRIDYDNAKAVEKFPLERMRRLARLVREVLEPLAGSDLGGVRGLLDRARATESAPLAEWDSNGGIPESSRGTIIGSPAELIAAVECLRQTAGGGASHDVATKSSDSGVGVRIN